MAMWRGGRREWGERGSKGEGERGVREQEREEGANSSSDSGPGLPGCCQVTVGWSLDRIPTWATGLSSVSAGEKKKGQMLRRAPSNTKKGKETTNIPVLTSFHLRSGSPVKSSLLVEELMLKVLDTGWGRDQIPKGREA